MIRLDIIADFACPWCYLGKAMLDRALEARPDHPFAVAWHPYQLDPGLPREGMDRIDYVKARFGSVDEILKVHEPLLAEAERAGVELNLPAIERQPNTLDAHRLAHWAGIEGRQAAVVSGLYRAFWREGRDICDPEVLARIAGAAGMDRDMVARLLASEADVEEVRKRIAHAAERGVRSVPSFIVADTHAIAGAQPPALWLQVIDELLAKDAPDAE
ncbi:DsbA family oxidoreductase [Frigidibacter sp. MR17.24]|uniref:DsbA family oxidoreductase n=1 Tax=Frigidibacter sp. MR17.24 TaxID=3127345 RepID=UPI003012C9FE